VLSRDLSEAVAALVLPVTAFRACRAEARTGISTVNNFIWLSANAFCIDTLLMLIKRALPRLKLEQLLLEEHQELVDMLAVLLWTVEHFSLQTVPWFSQSGLDSLLTKLEHIAAVARYYLRDFKLIDIEVYDIDGVVTELLVPSHYSPRI
jgi:hypothetical protein